MVKIIPQLPPPDVAIGNPKILYLGQDADEICDLLSPHIGSMSIDYVQAVQDALTHARAHCPDLIVVDLRGDNFASKLALPLFRELKHPHKIIVICALSEVGSYLRLPGVARVLTGPVRAGQLSRALGLDPNKLRHDKIKLAEEVAKVEAVEVKAPRRSPLVFVSNIGMQLVSTAYKRLAFVLLGLLFLSFTFYGLMIGFFLMSSTWAAPQTLTRGHMLVDRVEKDLGDLRLGLNLNKQRLDEAQQKADDAERAATEAEILVNFAGDTVSKEIVSRQRQVAVIDQNIARTEKIRRTFAKQLRAGGLSDDLAKLYSKHLIDRKAYTSNTLGLLETGQRLAGIESQLDILNSDRSQLAMQLNMLHSLKSQLKQTGPMTDITAASSDLLLLTKQALDARAAMDTARNEFDVSTKNRQTLLNSETVLEKQILTFEQSTLGRAITSRVDVLFVPYGNEARFQPGAALYTCKFTFVLCSKAGTVGQVLPGEIASVHPFFGKPIRGFFVEAKLNDIHAATREIIHAVHPPLYF
jgi:hypothetical protein